MAGCTWTESAIKYLTIFVLLMVGSRLDLLGVIVQGAIRAVDSKVAGSGANAIKRTQGAHLLSRSGPPLIYNSQTVKRK